MTKLKLVYLILDTSIVLGAYNTRTPGFGKYQAFLEEVLKHGQIRLLMAPPDKWPIGLDDPTLRPVQGTWDEWCEKITDLRRKPARSQPSRIEHPLLIWWRKMLARTLWVEQSDIETLVTVQLEQMKDDIIAYLKARPDQVWARKYLFEIGEDFHLIKGAMLAASAEMFSLDFAAGGEIEGGRVVADDANMRSALAGTSSTAPALRGIIWVVLKKPSDPDDAWRMDGGEFREWLRTGLPTIKELALG